MVCSNCGTNNPDGIRFCQKCGAALVSKNNPLQESTPDPVQTPAPAKKGKGIANPLLWVILGVVVMAMMGVILALSLNGVFSREDEASEETVPVEETAPEEETVPEEETAPVEGQTASEEPRFRETRYAYDLYDGTKLNCVTKYDGSEGRTEIYENDQLTRYSTFTCNDEGYIQTELCYNPVGTLLYRQELEYDEHGNEIRTARYDPDGNLESLIEREYNDVHVTEREITTYYDNSGAVTRQNIIEFEDRYHGVSYELDAAGNRTDKYTYLRVYDEDDQLVEEWSYRAGDGSMFRVDYYQRNQYHRLLGYTKHFSDGRESIYIYEYEQIG